MFLTQHSVEPRCAIQSYVFWGAQGLSAGRTMLTAVDQGDGLDEVAACHLYPVRLGDLLTQRRNRASH